MKDHHLLNNLGLVFLTVLMVQAIAEPLAGQDSMTYQQLLLARRKSDQRDPMQHLEPTKGEDPSVVNRPKSLLGESDIVSFGGFATLVPKRAILQIPKNYADRIQMKAGATLQSWKEFYALNRAWITTVEVTRLQAEGNDPIAEETKTQMTKTGNLIVATYLGGPISVLPLKVPVEKSPEKTKP